MFKAFVTITYTVFVLLYQLGLNSVAYNRTQVTVGLFLKSIYFSQRTLRQAFQSDKGNSTDTMDPVDP
jgi:hypothetical protein